MIDFRAAEQKDAHYLIDIDIKCFDDAWTPEDWRFAAKYCVACVATWNGAPVGMAVFYNDFMGSIEIVKVAVKRPYRNMGIARRLIFNCILYARELYATRLVMIVPESKLRPGEPDDLSEWLKALRFRAQVPLFKNYFTFCGEPEDGVVFTLPVPLT